MNCVPSGRDAAGIETTSDELLGGRVKLRQPRTGYRVAIDTVLLAAAVPARPRDRVLELGCGVGGAMLCLAARVPECSIVGVERQPEMATLAVSNIAANGLEGRLTVREGDISALPSCLEDGEPFDHVMLNPPFHAARQAQESPDPAKALAMREREDLGIDAWVRFGLEALRRKGMLTIVAPAARLSDVLRAAEGRAGQVNIIPLWPTEGVSAKPAKRVIVRMRGGVAGPLSLRPGLVLHKPSGGFTPDAERILRDMAPLLS